MSDDIQIFKAWILPEYDSFSDTHILTKNRNGEFGYVKVTKLKNNLDELGLASDDSNIFTGTQILLAPLFVSASSTFLDDVSIEGNLTIDGDIYVNNIISSSILYKSGSTKFGDTFDDIHDFTGSVNITGSTTQIGNNILVGNTVLSGSIDVSGSTNFHNHTITMTGSIYTSGSQTITGSLDVKGNINVASGSEFYLAGNKLFNYGQFSDTTIQSGSADTAYSMRLNTTDFAHNVTIVSGSRITPSNTGIYNLQFSAQLANSANTNLTFDIWLAYTGSNVVNSNTQIDVNKSAGQLGRSVAAWNWMLPIQANDYVEIKWSCNGSTGQIFANGTQTNPTRPAIPSVIATLTQIG